MTRIADGLHFLAVTIWAGSLWTVGLLVVPTLFDALPDGLLTGPLSARLFLYASLIGLGCALYLLLFRLVRFGGHALRQWIFWVVLLMVLLTAVGEFAMQPILAGLKDQALPLQVMESVFRDRFAAWHGVASLLYLIECALGVVLVLLQESAPR